MHSAQLCPTPCNPMDCNPPVSSVHGIFQAGILEWVAFPPPGELPYPGVEPTSPVSPALEGKFFILGGSFLKNTMHSFLMK